MDKILRLEDVCKTYGDENSTVSVRVLKDISLEVGRGESVAVVGPSGSGKSTLLNIMGGLDKPSTGSVVLDGRDLGGLSDSDLSVVRNRDIGFVFQFHHLLPHCTVMENVLVPTLPAASTGADERARALLGRVGMSERLHHMPGELSGGELQRVAVVRALVNSPKLLLADEPTGSLDRSSATELADLLVELNREQGVTLVLVTHSEELAARMGRHLVLIDGKVSENSRL